MGDLLVGGGGGGLISRSFSMLGTLRMLLKVRSKENMLYSCLKIAFSFSQKSLLLIFCMCLCCDSILS